MPYRSSGSRSSDAPDQLDALAPSASAAIFRAETAAGSSHSVSFMSVSMPRLEPEQSGPHASADERREGFFEILGREGLDDQEGGARLGGPGAHLRGSLRGDEAKFHRDALGAQAVQQLYAAHLGHVPV